MRLRKWMKWLLAVLVILLTGVNIIAYNHARCLSHFTQAAPNGEDIAHASWQEKLGYVLKGVPVQRPSNTWSAAEMDADSMMIPTERGSMELWRLHQPRAGNSHIILFPGYTRTKSNLVSEATRYRNLGFHVWMVDFVGTGGSSGNVCTGGYAEASDVRDACSYVSQAAGKDALILFHGNSMGSVAILRAISDYGVSPDGLILESPFGTLRSALSCRLEYAGIPTWPLADLVTFWGGAQHGYSGHGFNPVEYAEAVKCPVLHLVVSQDPLLPGGESREVFDALGTSAGHKTFAEVDGNQHREIVDVDEHEWEVAVGRFLLKEFPGKVMMMPLADPGI